MGVKISKGVGFSIGPIGLGEAHLDKTTLRVYLSLNIPSDIFFNYGAITGNIHQLHSETIGHVLWNIKNSPQKKKTPFC